MKFHVNADCIGCGFVREHLPRSFYHDGRRHRSRCPADVTGPDEAAATDAMQTCPVGAIESVDG